MENPPSWEGIRKVMNSCYLCLETVKKKKEQAQTLLPHHAISVDPTIKQTYFKIFAKYKWIQVIHQGMTLVGNPDSPHYAPGSGPLSFLRFFSFFLCSFEYSSDVNHISFLQVIFLSSLATDPPCWVENFATYCSFGFGSELSLLFPTFRIPLSIITSLQNVFKKCDSQPTAA